MTNGHAEQLRHKLTYQQLEAVKEVTVQNMHDYLETLRKFLARREPLDQCH